MALLFPLILRRRNLGTTSNKSKKMSSPPSGSFRRTLTPLQNNQFTPRVTGEFACNRAGHTAAHHAGDVPRSRGGLHTPHPGRVRPCGGHAPRQGASRVVTPRQSPGKQVASDKAWHLQETPLVAVPGVGASLRGLRAGRVKRLVAGIRH